MFDVIVLRLIRLLRGKAKARNLLKTKKKLERVVEGNRVKIVGAVSYVQLEPVFRVVLA